MHPEKTLGYAWEDQPQFQKTHIAAVKRQMLASYDHDHLYLVFNDTLGVMRDLAQEQDLVRHQEMTAYLEAKLLYDGCCTQSLMLVRISVQPEWAVSPLWVFTVVHFLIVEVPLYKSFHQITSVPPVRYNRQRREVAYVRQKR